MLKTEKLPHSLKCMKLQIDPKSIVFLQNQEKKRMRDLAVLLEEDKNPSKPFKAFPI